MVETYSRECVEATTKVLMKMSRTDLVQRLSGIHSGTEEEVCPPLVQREVLMTSIPEKLKETLEYLNDAELNHFKWILQKTVRQRGLPRILSSRMERAEDRADVVELMVAMYNEQSVDMTREVFRKMNRTDLVQKLPEISSASKDDHPNSGPVEAAESSTGSCSDAAVGAAGSLSGATGVSDVADEKHSVDEQLSAQLHKAAMISSDRERIQKMLEHLKESELKEFKWTLEDSNFMFMLDLPCIPRCKLDKADMLDLVDLMIQAYSQRSVEVTKKVFKKMNRNDLVLMLSAAHDPKIGSDGNKQKPVKTTQ
ncbi:uncharacterized protein LOC111578031 isoform X2 [Amphiprion ocellaris]|uniref:uncharacterized protein LOC111578031 isoform X2 n=1 Tax=Amphiprion ocellaris TaxID=80972 RepID=UPI00241131DE|nr:uncharacterized protein LOC111578031 isoform X2 [Amphiprion ocellaris]